MAQMITDRGVEQLCQSLSSTRSTLYTFPHSLSPSVAATRLKVGLIAVAVAFTTGLAELNRGNRSTVVATRLKSRLWVDQVVDLTPSFPTPAPLPVVAYFHPEVHLHSTYMASCTMTMGVLCLSKC